MRERTPDFWKWYHKFYKEVPGMSPRWAERAAWLMVAAGDRFDSTDSMGAR